MSKASMAGVCLAIGAASVLVGTANSLVLTRLFSSQVSAVDKWKENIESKRVLLVAEDAMHRLEKPTLDYIDCPSICDGKLPKRSAKMEGVKLEAVIF